MEELQNPVVDSLEADAKLVNAVAQEVGLGPSQFVAHRTEALQSDVALVLHFHGQFGEPVQEWA